MKSVLVKAGLLTAFVVFVGGTAQASTFDVKVPFPFLVRGQTLPAGSYSVEQEGSVVILKGEKGTPAVSVVLTEPISGRDPSGDKPALTFSRYEKQYRLKDVWEPEEPGLQIVR